MKYLIILLSALSLTSCSEDFFSQTVDVDPPAYDKQIVVHEFIGDDDDSLRIEVKRNFGILENPSPNDYNVLFATVQWYDNGQLAATLQPRFEEGWAYVAATGGLQAGHTYELRAEHADFPAIRAVQVMPAKPEVDSVSWRRNAGIDSEGVALMAFDVYLRDRPGEKNFYEIRVAAAQYYFEYEFDDNGLPVLDSLGQPVILDTLEYYAYFLNPSSAEDPNAEEGIGRGLLITDQLFDGQRYKFSFRGQKIYGDNGTQQFRLMVRSVTEEYYLYSLSRERQQRAEGNPLAEPVTVYDNIENGIGAFALFAERVYEIE